MARAESQHPGDDGNTEMVEGSHEAPAESGTTLKKNEQIVFCSPGAMSPEIDRILGDHIGRINTERPLEGNDEFYPPFLLLAKTEDIKMIEFTERAGDCGIPVQFLREKVMIPKFKPIDYYTLLSQWIHLVLYHAKKIEGGKWPGVRPIASEELNAKGLETAKNVMMRPECIPGIEQLAEDLRAYMQELSKKI